MRPLARTQREEILLELAFYQLEIGHTQAAYDTLTAYGTARRATSRAPAVTVPPPAPAPRGLTFPAAAWLGGWTDGAA